MLLSEKGTLLKEFAEFSFGSLKRTCEGITEKEADWKPAPESNDIRWILNHISRISNVAVPRFIKGDPEYIPVGWPEDYRNQTYAVDKLVSDIGSGKDAILAGLEGLTSEDFEEEIPLWGGTRKRKVALFAYLGEIVHHKGQIAALRGNIKRRREKDPEFLK